MLCSEDADPRHRHANPESLREHFTAGKERHARAECQDWLGASAARRPRMIWPFGHRAEGLLFTEHGETVPRFKTYYPTRAEMDRAQARFYRRFESEIAKGRALDVGENVSYVFCHCYEVQASNDLAMVARRMRELANAYAGSTMLSTSCSDWAIDALIGQGRYAEARAAFRDLPLDTSGSLRTDVLLSLKMQLGERPAGTS